MVEEEKLSDVLSEFARTLLTDFPIQAILDHLVKRIAEILPITSAGVTLISRGEAPAYVAAADAAALRFEQLQTDIGEGPCLSSYHSGEAVAVADLNRPDERFPRFAPAAVEAGLVAVFALPMRHGEDRFGALDLYRDTPGMLDPHDLEVAQTLADVAAAYLLNARSRDEARTAILDAQHIALHDALTGLPNRVLLRERLVHAAQRDRRKHMNVAVLFADLDRFKRVNDTHGHDVGDELLCAVADRLASIVRPGDTLARVSGDEFVFLCEDLHGPADAETIASHITDAFGTPFTLSTTTISVGVSVGVAFAGPGDEISDALVAGADKEMYRAKRQVASRWEIVDIRERPAVAEHQGCLADDLRAALDHGDLEVHYQPIVRVSDGLVTGVEALLRWTDPARGRVPAIAMAASAEGSGLIEEIGEWVLVRSCRDRSSWLLERPDATLDLAVNVSPRQLLSSAFPETVATTLRANAMDPSELVLEVTESIFIEEGERAMTSLAGLKDIGVRLALDDFGTGYSSLSYLLRLPIDTVKIDKGFITDMGRSHRGRAVVAGVTDMAQALGLLVIAEGVEDERQRDAVRALGCKHAQGYYYGRPVPAGAIAAQLGAPPGGPVHLPMPEVQPLGALR